MKLIFNSECSGDVMDFPFVGPWKSKEVKEVFHPNQIKSLLTFRRVTELNPKKRKELTLPEIKPAESAETINSPDLDSLKRDELIAECLKLGIDPPDKFNKTELKELLQKTINKNISKEEVI